MVEIALVGDLHSFWDERDVEYFNQSSYQTILVTGDLGSSTARDGVRIARSLSRIERPVVVMLGNNDAHEYPRIRAELNYQFGRADLLFDEALGGSPPPMHSTGGYSNHTLPMRGGSATLIAARPFAMGGSDLSHRDALAASFGVESVEQSADRLKDLVDQSTTEHVMFLAHNGPTGLGAHASAPFGRDFTSEAGDWGDRDLADAIAHAKAVGKKVLAVVAGHMHRTLRNGGAREWQARIDGTLYVNAACVPRHVRGDELISRHHVALQLTPAGAQAKDVWVPEH